MRYSIAVAALLLAACGQTPKQAAEPPEVTFDGAQASVVPAKVAHGDRLASVLGCRGCHGKDLTGEKWDDDPKEYGVMWASNLTRAVPGMTDAELRRLLTKGIHPRRKELWVMPSELFQHLSSADLDALIAYLRTMPASGEASPAPQPGPRALREIRSGLAKPAAVQVRERRNVLPVDAGPQYRLGRYITSVTCSECHGARLEGYQGEEGKTPDLVVASGYTRAEFEQLITRGIPTGGRKLHPLMQSVAKTRFSRPDPARAGRALRVPPGTRIAAPRS
jgi:cytochrome c553